jgi:hypothetical protein
LPSGTQTPRTPVMPTRSSTPVQARRSLTPGRAQQAGLHVQNNCSGGSARLPPPANQPMHCSGSSRQLGLSNINPNPGGSVRLPGPTSHRATPWQFSPSTLPPCPGQGGSKTMPAAHAIAPCAVVAESVAATHNQPIHGTPGISSANQHRYAPILGLPAPPAMGLHVCGGFMLAPGWQAPGWPAPVR